MVGVTFYSFFPHLYLAVTQRPGRANLHIAITTAIARSIDLTDGNKCGKKGEANIKIVLYA